MGLSRRSVLRTGSVALLSASIVKPALAAPAVIGLRDTGARTLSFNCYNTGEQLKATTYWADGKYIPDAKNTGSASALHRCHASRPWSRNNDASDMPSA